LTSARCPSIRLSVPITSSNRPIKIFFCWKNMPSDTYLLYFFSVHPFVQTDRKTKSSNAVLTVRFSKFFFFVGKVWHQIPIFCTFCRYMRSYRRAERKTKSSNAVLTVRFSNFYFCLTRYDTRHLYLINYFRLSVRFSVRLYMRFSVRLSLGVCFNFRRF